MDCTAFTQEPTAGLEPRAPGRPRKPAAEPEADLVEEPEKGKARKGRKRKEG